MAKVTITDLYKKYGDTEVIHGVDIEVADGEFVVLVGPSGCGKSTLLRMIAGLESVTSGTIRIGDRLVNNLPPAERGIAMVFQNYALYPHKTVAANMAFSLRMRRMDKREIKIRVDRAAAILGLEDYLDRYPRSLSGGQRQRIAIARAILADPRILILDEATSSLDSESEALIQDGLRSLREGRTTFVIAHRLSTIRSADQILVIEDGKIVERGSHVELIARGGNYAAMWERQQTAAAARLTLEHTNGDGVLAVEPAAE